MPGMFDVGLLAFGLFAADWLIRLGLVVRVIIGRRSVGASLAWIVVLLFAPVVGIVLYVLIGERRLGRRRLRRYMALSEGLERRAARFWQAGEDWTTDGETHAQIARICTAVAEIPPLRGNTLRLFGVAGELLDSLIADIDAAEHACHLLYYIWMVGSRPDEVGEALVRAAGRGVRCRVLVDAVGSKAFLRSPVARRLRDGGVHVAAALPANPVRMILARLDLRNHRKIAVIDGRIAYAGSQNLADETFKVSLRSTVGPWIDASVRVEGPAAQALNVIFLRDWYAETREPIDQIEDFLPQIERLAERGSTVQVVPSGPGITPAAIHRAVLTTIYSAREEIILTTPYFVPDEAMRSAIQTASMRGVRVTIVVPRRSNSPLVALAGRAHLDDMLGAGVRVMRFAGGLLHAKTITVDRRLALIGSANFDVRSFWLNFETTLFVYDTDFASTLRWLQTSYIEQSDELDPRTSRTRSVWLRGLEGTARLLGPLL